MPVEHETKFILEDEGGDLLRALSETLEPLHVEQFYVTENNRFRSTTRIVDGVRHARLQHTFKQMVGDKLLEIETDISSDDFELAHHLAKERIVKTRFSFDSGNGHWDVDFLRDGSDERGGDVYFALAEVEFTDGEDYVMPEVLAPYVVWEVPRRLSSAFTNRMLADQEHARSWQALRETGVDMMP